MKEQKLDKRCTDRYIVPGGTMDNRDQLIATAMTLFSQRGYDAVGVQEIVDQAGVTKPTLYHYFGNKEGLLQTVLDAYAGPLVAKIDAAADFQGDLPLTLDRMVAAYFSYAKANPVFFRLLLALHFSPAQSRQHTIAERVLTQLHAIAEEVFLKATPFHGNMKNRHQAYAASFQGVIHTYIGMALGNHVSLSETLRQQVVHQFQHGIYS